jgi:hypothetical protein
MNSNRSARWAVGIAVTVSLYIAFTVCLFAIAYARGGSDAISDNWVGWLGALAIIGGLIASFVAFIMAFSAKFKKVPWVRLRLPLLLFPVLLAFVVLSELFWWQ